MFHFLGRSRPIKLGPPPSRSEGTVVLSYLRSPFEGLPSSEARGHTNWQECRAIASAWCAKGFHLEVVDRKDRNYNPPSSAVAVIDLGVNLERWAPQLPPRCLKVLHATGAHWLTQNIAELVRLENLKARRGVALKPRRQNIPNSGIESADVACILGNEFTIDSFRFSGKRLSRVPISSAYTFDWLTNRDGESCRKRFLWVGSLGMVHKGLDLVLEAFAARPDLHLTVCGRPEKEPDFWSAYQTELTRLPNIHLEGWIDMGSERFAEIRRTHGAVIYPSCSEGGGGAVIHCMHAGLVPVVTRESSVDIGAFGVTINGGSVDAVGSALDATRSWSVSDWASRARGAWEAARACHTLEVFESNYAMFVEDILA